MGRDQRLRRMGIVRKQSQAPDPLDYWRERAKYFEQVVVAIVKNSPGEQVVLEDADIRGYALDAEPTETGGVRLKLLKRVAVDQVEQGGEKVLIVPKGAAVGPTVGGFCRGGEEGPICHGATGPHVHPEGFSGTPIRQAQEDDDV